MRINILNSEIDVAGYLAFTALIWLLVLSIGIIALTHGKEEKTKIAWVFVALAWISTVGVVVYEWIRSLL